MLSKKTAQSTFFVFTLLVISYTPLFFWGDEKLAFWVREDGFFETGGALFYLFASIIFFKLYIKSKTGNNFIFLKTKKNLFFLFLGILCFFCFGEEISWGQRLFNIETPEQIKRINYQNELNVHNLFFFHGTYEDGTIKKGIERWYTLERLYALFWFLYCILIPLSERSSRVISNFLKNLNLPIVPLWVGSLLLINYILAKAIEKTNLFSDIHPIIEIKEANLGFLFFVIGLSFYLTFESNSKTKKL